MEYEYWLRFLLVFISVCVADICWTMYFIKVNESKSIQAATWGSMISLLAAFTTINYVHDITLVIASVLGGFVGTVLSVEWNKRKKK